MTGLSTTPDDNSNTFHEEELTEEIVNSMTQEDLLEYIARISNLRNDFTNYSLAVRRSVLRVIAKLRGRSVANNPRASKTAKAKAAEQLADKFDLDSLLDD